MEESVIPGLILFALVMSIVGITWGIFSSLRPGSIDDEEEL